MDYLIAALGDNLCPEAQLAWKKLLGTLVEVIMKEQDRISKIGGQGSCFSKKIIC